MRFESIEKDWDIVVVGGGVTGAAVFRESARRGFKALLVEQKDFAWGTSSRSSKLVHGGLRYLKEGNFSLTRESVIQRERLIREAPGLVTPLEFRLPIYRGRKPGACTMEVGLSIYDLIAGKRCHRHYGSNAFSAIEPLAATRGLTGGFSFRDAQVDDARLVLRLIRTSERSGGLALNYARVIRLERDRDRNVCGVVLEDAETRETVCVQTHLVINATGVWAETIHPSPEKNRHLRPLRGSHLVFPEKSIPIETAVSFFSPRDGRQQFAVPWEGAVLVGTTDLDHNTPLNQEPAATQDEVAYLLEGVNSAFPSLELRLADAVSSFAGVRPVVSEGKVSADKESREHVIWKDRGLVTVTGGKLTTFRVLAEDALFAARGYLPGKRVTASTEPIFEAWAPEAVPAGFALAVCTPPHTSPASLTLRSLPWPVTFTSAPCSVLCMPSTLVGLSCPCTTWKVRMLFSMSAFVLSSSIVLAGSLSNAALVGANTVYWPLSRYRRERRWDSACRTTRRSTSTAAGWATRPWAMGSRDIPVTDAGPVGCIAA